MYVFTNYFVTDHSETEDDKAQENHPSKKRKFVEQQHNQQQARNSDVLHQVRLLHIYIAI